MAKATFPSYDVQTVNSRAGGIRSFIVHFAQQLRAWGDEVTIIAMEHRVDPSGASATGLGASALHEIRNEVSSRAVAKNLASDNVRISDAAASRFKYRVFLRRGKYHI